MPSKKGGQRQSGNPAKRATAPSISPSASGPHLTLRQRFERASTPAILTLARLPRWAFPLLMAVLLLAGLIIEIAWIGGLLLSLLVLALIWLTALSWPALTVPGRLLRLVTICAAAAVAFARLTGRM